MAPRAGFDVSRNRYARSDGLRIAYDLRGAMHRRRPWLVLIQGMGLDRSGWEPVLRKLGRRFRLALIDNRGTGRSDRPSGSFTVADMADDVVAVLDSAGIDRAHVLGASLGGMVAQELAITCPKRVDALVAQATARARYAGHQRRARIRARTLVMHGGADTVVDPRNAKLLADRIPDARLVTFPELGHLLFWEDPDGFADAAASFLLGLDGGRDRQP
jgi:pimeloyl-ACP methyl ester carboxylesterase